MVFNKVNNLLANVIYYIYACIWTKQSNGNTCLCRRVGEGGGLWYPMHGSVTISLTQLTRCVTTYCDSHFNTFQTVSVSNKKPDIWALFPIWYLRVKMLRDVSDAHVRVTYAHKDNSHSSRCHCCQRRDLEIPREYEPYLIWIKGHFTVLTKVSVGQNYTQFSVQHPMPQAQLGIAHKCIFSTG